MRLDPAEAAERPGEDEEEVRADDFKAAAAQQGARLGEGEGDGVLVELAAAHHVARRRVPGVVLPEGQQAAGPERVEDVAHRVAALGGRDVVEDVVGDGHVNLLRGPVLAEQHEARAVFVVQMPRHVERL